MPPEQEEEAEPNFEEVVSALLKVDPKGLSGKHRKPTSRENEEEPVLKESD